VFSGDHSNLFFGDESEFQWAVVAQDRTVIVGGEESEQFAGLLLVLVTRTKTMVEMTEDSW